MVYKVWLNLGEAPSAPTQRLRRFLYPDEVFVRIHGQQHYLWRAVDQDGEVVDVFLQRRRDGKAAKRFLGRLLRESGD